MKILFAGNKERGVSCLKELMDRGHEIVCVVAHHGAGKTPQAGSVVAAAGELSLPLLAPLDINDPGTVESLKAYGAELMVMAGYGPILHRPMLTLAPLGCVNLHGGKLPQYRGSSPMNWALINGETSFTISVVFSDDGVDSGAVLAERTFPIGIDDTIVELQAMANAAFPEMLATVIDEIGRRSHTPRAQDAKQAEYYPLRFPDDGLIIWDDLSALEAHNMIRALAEPFPCAFTFFEGRRVRLLRSMPARMVFHGVPGRVYMKNSNGLLVCARDRCLWIKKAVFEDTREDAVSVIPRYGVMSSHRELVLNSIRALSAGK